MIDSPAPNNWVKFVFERRDKTSLTNQPPLLQGYKTINPNSLMILSHDISDKEKEHFLKDVSFLFYFNPLPTLPFRAIPRGQFQICLHLQWNVTPLIRRSSNFYFFAALYFALLDLLSCLQAQGTRDCNVCVYVCMYFI